MTKERHNRFNMPLPNYVAQYVPHCFVMPQHVLVKSDNPMRLIFDAAKHYTATSVPINMMTPTHIWIEMECLYGDTFKSLLNQLYDLCIMYPSADIITPINDVKS